jgi:hypothetical protein
MHTLAANKALICWCSESTQHDTIVKVADVGFLGLLGTLALSAAWAPLSGLQYAHTLILQACVLFLCPQPDLFLYVV